MNLEVFKNSKFGEVRVVVNETTKEPYFVLADICKVLGLTNPTEVAKSLPEDDLSNTEVIDTIGRKQKVNVVTESGLYKVIFKSRKEEALAFQDWVTKEVLPSIRKHGMYVKDELLNDLDLLVETIVKLKAERDKAIKEKAWIGSKREATAMATASKEARRARKLEIQLDESKEFATIKRVEIETGNKFGWRQIKKYSKEKGYPVKKVFDANYGEVNSYYWKAWLEVYGIDIREF